MKSASQVLLITLLFFTIPLSFAQEICDNALDDDGDGLIDLNDPDCQNCNYFKPIHQMIPNPSFEDYSLCPNSHSQMSSVLNWVQASGATSDYYNSCGYLPTTATFPIAPINPLPLPDGDGFVGFFVTHINSNYGEYVSACLNTPMIAGKTYSISFYIGMGSQAISTSGGKVIYGDSSVTIGVFGTDDCSNIPFGFGSAFLGCPTNAAGFELLSSATVHGSDEWVRVKTSFTPTKNVNAILLGGDCLAVNINDSLAYFYYYLDHIETYEGKTKTRSWINNQPCFMELHGIDTFASYQWYKEGVAIPGAIDSIFSTDKPGIYRLRTLDSLGNCYLSDSLIVGNKGVHFPILAGSTQKCRGTPSYLQVVGNFSSHFWDTPSGNFSGGQVLTGDSGWYKLTVIDHLGCKASDSLYLSILDNPSATIEPTDIACFGDSSGQIQVFGYSPQGGLQYQLNQGQLQGNGHFRNLPVGSYSITLIDGQGCDTLLTDIQLSQPPQLALNIQQSDVSCFGEREGEAEATVTGGVPPYTYHWTPGNRRNRVVTNLAAGVYQLSVTDAHGCIIRSDMNILEPPELRLRVLDISPAYCERSNGGASVYAEGGTGDYFFMWTGDSLLTGNTSSRAGLGEGSYQVEVIDENNCRNVVTLQVPHDPSPTAAFTVSPDVTEPLLLSEANFTFTSTSQHAKIFEWDFGDGYFSGKMNPKHTYAEPDSYRVQLIVHNHYHNACPDTAWQSIVVIPDAKLFFPNAFSPNGDSKNDVWLAKGEGWQSIEIHIFNRWGERLTVLHSLDEYWDGTYQGKSVQEGVYVFHAKARTRDEVLIERSGTITLIR